MEFITYSISRTRAVKRKSVTSTGKGSKPADVAKAVLVFLSYGLTNGAQSLSEQYTPASKVDEFVTVSGEILGALKRAYEERFTSDSVKMFMKVNYQQKQI